MVIKRFNESLDNIDIDYIDECFVDIIDRLEYTKQVYSGGAIHIEIKIPDKYTTPYFSGSTETMLEILEWKTDLLKDIRYSLDFVKIKYKDLAYSICFNEHENMDEGSGYVEIGLSEKTQWNTQI